MDGSLFARIHIAPDALARSPGHVRERYANAAAVMQATLAYLRPLPPALVARWLRREEGHVVIDAMRHGFRAGENPWRDRVLRDVAWVRLRLLVDEPVDYLAPVGALIAWLIGWGRMQGPDTQPWRDFEQGVRSAFAAGYGRSEMARADVDAYLAEGIAWFLADRRGLNLADPRLEKLLRATVFNEAWCQWLG
jgi:hypothetical protein